ncbi:MAG: hypothetical protein KIT18_00685 [Burkholderiales bacterium]|nr:hypothetical protein [Burkholderiales bacterium]
MPVDPAPQGVELHFPPRRAMGPLALGGFGALCVILPVAALPALIPSGSADAYGLIAIAIIGTLIAPFPAFGAAFIVLAAYTLCGSLDIHVNPAAIATIRRIFGVALLRRALACSEIASIDIRPAPRYRNPLGGPRFRLVARHIAQRSRDLVIAEDLESEAAAAQMQVLIARHAGLASNLKDPA